VKNTKSEALATSKQSSPRRFAPAKDFLLSPVIFLVEKDSEEL